MPKSEAELIRLAEEVRAVDLSALADAAQWDSVFSRLTELIASKDARTRAFAFERIGAALWAERMAGHRFPPFSPLDASKRLKPIFAAVEAQKQEAGACLELLSAHVLPGEDEASRAIVRWIDELDRTRRVRGLGEAALLAVRIRFCSTDAKARPWLVKALAHKDASVRANAASALGSLHAKGASGLPALSQELGLIRDLELKNPGVAGPFFGALQFDLEDRDLGPAEIRAWMLDILARRSAPEPSFPPGFLGIDFYLHEWLSGDPAGIKRVLELGRADIAVAAAAANDGRDERIEPLLVELAGRPEPEVCRQASWHLAYHHRLLHPEGARRGFVSGLSHLPETLILLNRLGPEAPSPYAATLYAKERESALEDAALRRWIDRILPERLRGATLESHESESRLTLRFGQATVALYRSAQERRWDRAIVGWRGKGAWDPRGLLEGA